MRTRRWMRAAATLAALMTLASPGWADVSMTVTPDASVSWTLTPVGVNTTSGGSMTVSATQDYIVTVTADRARLTEYDTGTSSYVPDGKTLDAALNVTAVRTGGTAAVPGVGATAVIGTSTTLAAGVGAVLGATDEYAITLSQATALTDEALPSGSTYRIVLTYTASSLL